MSNMTVPHATESIWTMDQIICVSNARKNMMIWTSYTNMKMMNIQNQSTAMVTQAPFIHIPTIRKNIILCPTFNIQFFILPHSNHYSKHK